MKKYPSQLLPPKNLEGRIKTVVKNFTQLHQVAAFSNIDTATYQKQLVRAIMRVIKV